MKTKIMNLFRPVSLSNYPSFSLLVMRLIAGAAMMVHGWGKIQNPFGWMPEASPVPGFFQFLAAVSEFGGGLAWILGLLTALSSLGLVFTMAVAVLFHVAVLGDPFFSMGPGSSAEPAALFLVIALVLMAVGPGRFSLDMKIFGLRK